MKLQFRQGTNRHDVRYSIKGLSSIGLLLACALFTTSALAAAPASVTMTSPLNSFANTCAAPSGVNPTVNITTVNSISPNAHDNYVITAPGFGGFTWIGGEQTGASGSGNYGLGTPVMWNINVPAGTPITATIYTYATASLTSPIYSSAIAWNCTTGAVLSITNTDLTVAAPPAAVAPESVPTLSEWGMIILAGLMVVLTLTRMRPRKDMA